MNKPVSLAVIGAGLIGRRHIEQIRAVPDATLHAIVDPTPAAREFAQSLGIPWFETIADMLQVATPDGAIVATPNRLHVDNGLALVRAGVPALIEKPIADDVAAAASLVAAAAAAGVALAVGHHRRHNPMIQRAKAIIDSGRLGRIVTAHAFFWLMKPDDYFDIAWRREAGAGPVLVNMIHDIDLLRHLCGDIVEVQAIEANPIRGHAVEESAVVLLRFANGALGTVNISDSAVAPWSWEQTTGENPAYPKTDQACYQIGGTHASLAVPSLEVWSNGATRGWMQPLNVERHYGIAADPLRLQIEQFCRVVRQQEPPLVPGSEGVKSLAVIDAIKTAARTGRAARPAACGG